MKEIDLSDSALMISELHYYSGLTWNQIGRVLGVSQRTAQCWATGYAITPRIHFERAAVILRQVIALDAPSPAEARTAILATLSEGGSLFQRWLRERPMNSEVIQYSNFQLSRDTGRL